MAILNITCRQHSRFAFGVINAELSNGATIELPPGAIVLSGGYNIVTAATGTLPTISLEDNQDTPLAYMTDVAFAVADAAFGAGIERQYYPAGALLTFSIGGTDPVGGKAFVWVEYLGENLQDELFGRSA